MREDQTVALKNASPEVMAELHRRGVREFWALDSDDFEMEAQPFAKVRYDMWVCVAGVTER